MTNFHFTWFGKDNPWPH